MTSNFNDRHDNYSLTNPDNITELNRPQPCTILHVGGNTHQVKNMGALQMMISSYDHILNALFR